MNPNETEKLPRIQTAYAGIFCATDPAQPMFPTIVNDALKQLASLKTGKTLLEAIAAANPAVDRGFKVLIHRVDVAFKMVITETKKIGYEMKQQGGRPYASGVCDANGVRVTAEADGRGASAVVGFCPNIVRVTDHQRGNQIWVPAAITLGHELIHALHVLQGTSKSGRSMTIGGKSVSIEEAQTVGLGPYATEAITENGLRADLKIPERLGYP